MQYSAVTAEMQAHLQQGGSHEQTRKSINVMFAVHEDNKLKAQKWEKVGESFKSKQGWIVCQKGKNCV